jgi:hypothetical protein
MNLLLDLDQTFSVFVAYNSGIWPMQVFAYLAGLVALYSATKHTRFSNNIAAGILSFFWMWTGAVFCVFYWAPSYPAAYAFGVLFVAQGVVFLLNAIKPKLSFRSQRNSFALIGWLFIAYAMVGYPLAGHFLGHIYPRSLPFGLVPCPTAVFTLGLLMLTNKLVPRYILVIPAIWSICAIVPVVSGIYEDAGLILAGLICIPMLLKRDRGLIFNLTSSRVTSSEKSERN